MNEFLQIVINSVGTGIGVAIGTHLAQKGMIKHLDNIVTDVKKATSRRD